MPETQSTAIAVTSEPVRSPISGMFQTVILPASRSLVRAGTWAGDIAQEFGTLVADLLSPAVFTVYSIAAWSLAASLGWTDSFIFGSGPLASWLIWLGIAILLNVASSVLKRHIQAENRR